MFCIQFSAASFKPPVAQTTNMDRSRRPRNPARLDLHNINPLQEWVLQVYRNNTIRLRTHNHLRLLPLFCSLRHWWNTVKGRICLQKLRLRDSCCPIQSTHFSKTTCSAAKQVVLYLRPWSHRNTIGAWLETFSCMGWDTQQWRTYPYPEIWIRIRVR